MAPLQIWNQQIMGRLGSKPRKAAILGEENSYDKQG